jgi:hypothetical protein
MKKDPTIMRAVAIRIMGLCKANKLIRRYVDRVDNPMEMQIRAMPLKSNKHGWPILFRFIKTIID